MANPSADVFKPKHDVFGGQTSLNAANNPDLFKEAYNAAVNSPFWLIKTREVCNDNNGAQLSVWLKDWTRLIPPDSNGNYQAGQVGEWLWKRFIGDGLRNYATLERAQVTALLATGFDLSYLADPNNPNRIYSANDINSSLAPLVLQNEQTLIDLNNPTTAVRREANRRIGMAVSFISMTPFSFAMEGDLAPTIDPAAQELEHKGTIQLVTGKRLTIDGFQVWISSETVVNFDNNTSGVFEVGQDVEFKAQPNTDGSLTAVKISVAAGNTTTPPTNAAPTASANGPYAGQVGTAIAFSNAGSFDPDNDPLTYNWDFGDGTASTLPNPSHSYATAGLFSVSLSVDDGNGGTDIDITSADISAPPPPPTNSNPSAIANGPYAGQVGAAIAISSAGSFDPDNDPLTYNWDFGDGTASTLPNPSHSYATAGLFSVSLSVDDGNGGTDIDITSADISAPPPPPTNSTTRLQLQTAPTRVKWAPQSRLAAPGHSIPTTTR